MGLFRSKDVYDVEREMRKAKTNIRLAIAFLFVIIITTVILLLAFITDIGIKFLEEKLINFIFSFILLVIIILILIKVELSAYQASGIIVKINNEGIYTWDEIEQKEINRVNFKNIKAVYWDPSRRYTYISILEEDVEGNINWKYFIKDRMESQSKIQNALKDEVKEFYNKRLDDQKIRKILAEKKKRKQQRPNT